MKQGNNILVDIVTYAGLGGLILLMTKPGGPKLVTAGTRGYADILQASTGQAVTA